METDAKVEATKKKVKKSNVPISEVVYGGMLPADVQKAVEKENDFILVPYNPGRHWVLVVIDMKAGKCYYLDSLEHSTINQQLKQIIDAAMLVYTTQSGSDKRINLMWEQVRVPKQPGSTECGYYVCKFTNEIIDNGLDVLINANIGDGKQVYKDVDLDEICEDWAHYVSNFVLA